MEKEITPKKTILVLAILFSFASYFALDHHYKTRTKDVIFTIVNSSGELIKVNNFMQFGSTIKFVMSREPFIKTIILFDKDFRKLLSFGDEIDISTEFPNFNDEKVQILHRGPLGYMIKYAFNNDSDIIMIALFHDDKRFITLFIMISLIFCLFGCIYIVCQRLDFDNLNARAAKHALDLMSCGFHEMKQTVELVRILQEQIRNNEVSFKSPFYAQMFTNDFDKNMIAVDSMMSILKLTNKRRNENEFTPIEIIDIINACVNTYKCDNKSIDIKYHHHSKLSLSKDILYATIGNLIKNAYMYSDGLIWIRTYEEDKQLVFAIANTGRAIPKEKQKAILKPGIALKGQTGLGLHICDMWCRKIGARLTLESNPAATQFVIYFPITNLVSSVNKPAEQHTTAEIIQLHASEEKMLDRRVAVIDDIKTFRVSICNHLQQLGFQAEHFENMDIFLDRLKHDPLNFEFVLIDRHGNGFDAVKDRFPDSCRYYGYRGKIILYSSDLPNINEQELRQKGFDFAVKKGSHINWGQYLQ